MHSMVISKALFFLLVLPLTICTQRAAGAVVAKRFIQRHRRIGGTTHEVQVGKRGSARLIEAPGRESTPKKRRRRSTSSDVKNIGKFEASHTGEDLARNFEATGPNAPVEDKYALIYSIHHSLAIVFGKNAENWYSDWKLWVGASIWFAVWTKWLMIGYEEEFWVQALFTFGINIVILHHLQYALTVKWGMLTVCLLLCAQAIFQSYMWSKAKLSADIATDGSEEFLCETMYLDLALPAAQVAVLFVAQVCISWFYMTYILANFDVSTVNYTFWAVAYLSMQMTMIFCRGGDSVLGKAFPSHDVYQLLVDCKQITLALKDAGDGSLTTPRKDSGKPFQISFLNLLMRGVTGFFCNAILREILAYTIPLMLMSFADPMDFVVYCVGVNFICTIDDTKDRTYVVTYVEDGKHGRKSYANLARSETV